MKSYKRITIVLSIMFVIVISGLTVIFGSNYKNPVYKLDNTIVLNENVQSFMCEDGKILFVSCDENKTNISKFNPDNGNLELIKRIEGSFNSTFYINEMIYLASSNFETNSTEIKGLNINNLPDINDIIVTLVGCVVSSQDDFLVDSEGYLYVINDNARNNIIKYNDNGSLINLYQAQSNFNALTPNLNNNQLFTTNENGEVIKILENDLHTVNCPEINESIRFINENIIADDLGNIYTYLNDEFIYNYNSFASFYNIGLYNNNTLISLFDKAYCLDENGTAIGEFNITNGDSQKIMNFNNTIISINSMDDEIFIEVIKDDATPVKYEVFDKWGEDFTTSPRAGKVNIDDIPADNKWFAILDTNKNTAEIRGKVSVIITDEDTGETWIRDEKDEIDIIDNTVIEFLQPDNINLHTYSIEIKDLCNNLGKPSLCKYSIEFVNEPTPPKPDNIITSDVYNINRQANTISNIKPGTTITMFKQNINYDGELEFTSLEGNVITSGKIGTGTTVTLFQDEMETDVLTVLIYGDLTGDGIINSSDVQSAINNNIGKEDLIDISLKSFDINHNETIDNLDMILLQYQYKGKYQINQDDGINS